MFGSSQNQTGKSPLSHFSGVAIFIVGILLSSFLRQCLPPSRTTTVTTSSPSVEAPLIKTPPTGNAARSERLTRIDETCRNLPQPQNFNFVSKNAATENERFVSVVYGYRSPRAKQEIYPVFILWFGENGWTNNQPAAGGERLEFSKGIQTVAITHYSLSDGEYFSVNCTEWNVP